MLVYLVEPKTPRIFEGSQKSSQETHQIVQICHVAIVGVEFKLSGLCDLEQMLDTGLEMRSGASVKSTYT